MERVRVLLVDGHALFRAGLALVLSAQPDFDVVGEAEDGQAALDKAQALQPDLILININLAGGNSLGVIRRLKYVLPHAMVIILTGTKKHDLVLRALLAGADGYLLKSLQVAEFLEVLRGALSGEADPVALHAHTLQAYRGGQHNSGGKGERGMGLTPREQEIVRLVGMGASNKEIARALHLSINTVKTHVRHILDKLQVASRRQIVRYTQLDAHDDEGGKD